MTREKIKVFELRFKIAPNLYLYIDQMKFQDWESMIENDELEEIRVVKKTEKWLNNLPEWEG